MTAEKLAEIFRSMPTVEKVNVFTSLDNEYKWKQPNDEVLAFYSAKKALTQGAMRVAV